MTIQTATRTNPKTFPSPAEVTGVKAEALPVTAHVTAAGLVLSAFVVKYRQVAQPVRARSPAIADQRAALQPSPGREYATSPCAGCVS